MSAAFEALARAAGVWRGESVLTVRPDVAPETSSSTATVETVVGGRFVRIDYGWASSGGPEEGSLLVGEDPRSGEATVHWIDTWHMDRAVLALRGSAKDGGVDVLGSYSVGDSPAWGWRIRLEHADGRLTVRMWNIEPDGTEHVAVEARYTR